MKVAVFDTYVTRKDGRVMNFDVLVPEGFGDLDAIYSWAREYVESKGESGESVRSEECTFCHIEEADEETAAAIEARGHQIVELENCD